MNTICLRYTLETISSHQLYLNYFQKYFLSLIERIYNEVGLEDVKNNPMLTVYKRVDILTAACHLGQKQCVNECISKFHTWMHEVNPEFNNP